MSLRCEWNTYRQYNNARTGTHSLEIIDTQGNLSGDFQIDYQNGFEITYGGSPKDRWPTIQPASCRFTMKVTHQHHYQLAQSIGTSTNINRFIVIYRRGARPVFIGCILTEATTLVLNPDILIDGFRRYDGSFVITAVDGLTMLQRRTMLIAPDDLPRTFDEWFRDIFRYNPTIPHMLGIPYVFQTSWVPDTGSANFLLNQAVAPASILDRQKRFNQIEYKTAWDVLKIFCETFNMRCRSAYGFYLFQQMEDLNAPGYGYNKDFGFVGTYSLVEKIQDADTDELILRAPEITTWVPPIRGAEVIFKADFNSNLLLGNKFDLSVATSGCYNDVSNVTVKTGLERLRIIGSIEFTPFSGTYEGLLRIIFKFTIKVGSNYYVRDILNYPDDVLNPIYTAPQWQGSFGYYYEVYDQLVTLPAEDERKFYIPVFFSTHRLERAWDDELLSMCFAYDTFGFDDANPLGFQLLTKAEVEIKSFLDDTDVAILDQENNLVEPVDRIVKIETNPDNEIEVTRTIFFSTGPNKGSKSRITDDSRPPIDTINWTVPGLGTDYHYNILLKSLAARGQKAATFMETVIEGPYQNSVRLSACGATWLWWTGRYYHSEHMEFHKGEFIQLSIDPVDAVIDEEDVFDIVERPPVPTKSLSGPNNQTEIEITGITGGTINADTYGIPMPNTEGWTDQQIRSIVTYNKSGNIQRYKDPPTLTNEFSWDNANRNFIVEQSKAHLWHIFRVYR